VSSLTRCPNLGARCRMRIKGVRRKRGRHRGRRASKPIAGVLQPATSPAIRIWVRSAGHGSKRARRHRGRCRRSRAEHPPPDWPSCPLARYPTPRHPGPNADRRARHDPELPFAASGRGQRILKSGHSLGRSKFRAIIASVSSTLILQAIAVEFANAPRDMIVGLSKQLHLKETRLTPAAIRRLEPCHHRSRIRHRRWMRRAAMQRTR
jgi:hypothetical protein